MEGLKRSVIKLELSSDFPRSKRSTNHAIRLTLHKLGWIGAGGRMGYAMAERLAKAGADVAVYNRTRAKVEPLAKSGCSIVEARPRWRGATLFS